MAAAGDVPNGSESDSRHDGGDFGGDGDGN